VRSFLEAFDASIILKNSRVIDLPAIISNVGPDVVALAVLQGVR